MICRSLKEFALAVGAEPKWILNAAPRLRHVGLPFAYTDADAKWLRLARVLNRELRIPLPYAAKLARRAVSPPGGSRVLGSALGTDRNLSALVENPGNGLSLVLDLDRYEVTFETALAAAKAFGAPRRAGRKLRQPAHYQAALGRAWRLGIDVVALRAAMRYPLETRLGGRSRWDLERAAVGMGDHPTRTAHRVPPLDASPSGQVAEMLRRLRVGQVRAVLVGELAEVVRGAPTVHPKPCIDVCYEPSRRNIRTLTRVLRDMDARPQLIAGEAGSREPSSGGSSHLPEDLGGSGPRNSSPDAATFAASPFLALGTRFGALTLRPGVGGLGRFSEVERHAGIMKVFGVDTPVLELPALRVARQAAGTGADVARLPYLDSLMAIPLLDERRREVAHLRAAMDRHLKQ